MKRLLTFLILPFILSSCSRARTDEEEPGSLYRQRIENSRYVLYDFSYPGKFVTSSDFSGLTILDSNATFSRSRIEELPCFYFSTKPKIGNLKMLDISNRESSEGDTLLIPTRQYSRIFNGIEVEVTEYNNTYGSATMSTGLMEYEFDNFQETRDSLIFHNVTKKFGGRIFPSTTSFLKGNITVIDSLDNTITYIQIVQAIIGRGNIYKPTSPLELVPDQPIVGFATYRFYPRTKINSRSMSEYGVWKRVK
jgi:hypothetical protein